MIRTKKELKEYIKADESRYHLRKPRMLGWLLGDESYVVTRYLNVLRHLEYYTNKRKLFWDYLPFIYYLIRHRRMSLSTGIRIGVNKVGKGLYIPHFGGGIIVNCKRVGDYCIISSGVVIGNKGDSNNVPTIGNYVEVTIGSKIIGKVTVGNNVIIAPNSVVVKDVADNCIVSGIPAKLLKMKL